MRVKEIVLLLVVFLALGTENLHAQQEMSLYHAGRHVYQSNALNPSFFTDKDNFSIYSIYFNMSHDGFRLKDILREREQDDSLDLAIDSAIARMSDNNYLNFNFNIDLINFKFKHRRNHFGFGLSIKENTSFSYPRQFMEFLLLGNGSQIGKTMDLGIDFKTMLYNEMSFSYMREMGRLKLGGRAKLLTGVATVGTTRSDAYFQTNDSTLSFSVGADYYIRSSGSNTLQSMLDGNGDILVSDIMGHMFNFQNMGLGFDLGMTYELTKRVDITASVLDIGSIRWKSDVVSYESRGDYTFGGLDLIEFALNDSVTFDTYADEIVDTLEKTFTPTETNESFVTNLVPRHYLGTNIDLVDSFNLSILVYGDLFKGYRPNFSIGLTKQIGDWLNLGVNYSIKNRSYENIGASLVINPGPTQFFFMADNLYSLIDPYGATSFNFRMGMNARFRFVRPKLRPKDF